MKKEIGLTFAFLALIALLCGLLFGTLAAFQFVFPDFFTALPFFKNRPLHVSLVVAWIFLSSIGGIYYYLPKFCGLELFSKKMALAHAWMFVITGVLVVISYLVGKFGGREYWEFPVVLAIPIFLSWLLFGINFFKTVFRKLSAWPVYIWMWATGICFFLFTFVEAYLWLFPHFSNNQVLDTTVQWKAYGALTGSWNMLVYGTAIFLMERIKGDQSISRSNLAFAMYFLGLTNLMFGWAHHIYIVPTATWIRYLAYAVSMTELLILARLIRHWRASLDEAKKNLFSVPFRFIIASDQWIILNLTLAIAISVPVINAFTHGTHITVAHAMGSTIGINTMILLASVHFIVGNATACDYTSAQIKSIKTGFWITNISLAVFWINLIIAGATKGMLIVENKLTFQEIMMEIEPYLISFAFAGLGIFVGLVMAAYPALRASVVYMKAKQP